MCFLVKDSDECYLLELDKRLDRLETKQDVLFERVKVLEIYVNVKKALNHVNDVKNDKRDDYWFKIRFMVFGILLTLITAILEHFLFKLK